MKILRPLQSVPSSVTGDKFRDFRQTIASLIDAVVELQAFHNKPQEQLAKKHYLIQWAVLEFAGDNDGTSREVLMCKVGWFTDEELEKFCAKKEELKVTHLG